MNRNSIFLSYPHHLKHPIIRCIPHSAIRKLEAFDAIDALPAAAIRQVDAAAFAALQVPLNIFICFICISSFPSSLLKRPHHRREQVFENGAGPKVNFRRDLHAG